MIGLQVQKDERDGGPTHFVAIRTNAPHIADTAKRVVDIVLERDLSLQSCVIEVCPSLN
jgi:hypothetical protein